MVLELLQGQALFGRPSQAAANGCNQLAGDCRVRRKFNFIAGIENLVQAIDELCEDCEGWPAVGHFVQDAAEGPNIAWPSNFQFAAFQGG